MPNIFSRHRSDSLMARAYRWCMSMVHVIFWCLMTYHHMSTSEHPLTSDPSGIADSSLQVSSCDSGHRYRHGADLSIKPTPSPLNQNTTVRGDLRLKMIVFSVYFLLGHLDSALRNLLTRLCRHSRRPTLQPPLEHVEGMFPPHRTLETVVTHSSVI